MRISSIAARFPTAVKKIALGICGSIAAYRSPDLLKKLVALGHEVQPLVTQSALEFVTPKVLETFAGRKILLPNVFAEDHLGTDHISAARWAENFIVYGATANFIAKMAQGFGDDFLSLQLLAFKGHVTVAPAMNPTMWEHPAVAENVAKLKTRGVKIAGPIWAKVACGEEGLGHIATDDDIIKTALGSI